MQITMGMLSNHDEIKLEINNRKIAGKSQNTWKLNNALVHNKRLKEKCQGKLKDILN